MLVSFIFFFATLAAMSRRLHDAGYSAWNYLWSFTVIGALYVLYLLVRPSDDAVNAYGKIDPLVEA